MWGQHSFGDAPFSSTVAEVRHGDYAETLAPSETFLKQVDKLLAEAVALTEARTLSLARTMSETLGLAEGFSAVKTTFKDIGDTLGFTEGFGKQINKAITETVALTEARLLSVSKGVAETVGLAEGFTAVKTAFRTLTDTLGVTEAFTKGIEKIHAETVGLSEILDTDVAPGAPAFIFKAQVVPVYVHPDPAVPGVVPMHF